MKNRNALRRNKRLSPCLLVLLLCFPVHLLAQDIQTEIIYSNRADEIVPLLSALAAPEGSVTSYRDQLIIRAPADKMPAILESLKQIDRPLKNLRISVRRQKNTANSSEALGAQGDIRIQNGQIGGRVDITVQKRQAQKNQQDSYSVTAVEGASVQIATGSELPYLTVINSNTQMTAFGQQYVPVQSGMVVTPRLQPDGRVMLDIRFQQQAPGRQGSIQSESVQSQVRSRLGEWTQLSNIEQSITVTGSGIASQYKQQAQSSTPIEIMVEELP